MLLRKFGCFYTFYKRLHTFHLMKSLCAGPILYPCWLVWRTQAKRRPEVGIQLYYEMETLYDLSERFKVIHKRNCPSDSTYSIGMNRSLRNFFHLRICPAENKMYTLLFRVSVQPHLRYSTVCAHVK